jgi:hypothetical protein
VAVLPPPELPRTDGRRDCRDVVLVCFAAGFDVVGGLSTNEVSVVMKVVSPPSLSERVELGARSAGLSLWNDSDTGPWFSGQSRLS